MNKPIYEQPNPRLSLCEPEDKCCTCFSIDFGMKYIAYLSFSGFLFVIIQALQTLYHYNFFYGLISVLIVAPNVKACQLFYQWVKNDNRETRETLANAINFNIISVVSQCAWLLLASLVFNPHENVKYNTMNVLGATTMGGTVLVFVNIYFRSVARRYHRININRI